MIQSVKRTFEILEYISSNGNLVRLNDIAKSTGLQSTTVHNLLTTLKELGMVEQDDVSPRYRITQKIGNFFPHGVPLYQLKASLKPLLESMTKETNETTYLAIQLGNYFRYELKCEPKRSIRISLELGREEEMKHTAIGKIFMAYSPHLQSMLLKDMNKTERIEQEKEIEKTLKNGYVFDFEEYESELNCLAVPYFNNGKIAAVIGVAGPAYRFGKEQMTVIAQKLNVTLNTK